MRNKKPAVYGTWSISLDPEYEKFRASTGHLTDFAPDRLSLYKAAVEKFADPTTGVREGYHPGAYALYSRLSDLSDFWVIFRGMESLHK